MNVIRRFLGIFVMFAGVIGLILSLAGLVGLWVARPIMISTFTSTLNTLESSLSTSQETLDITGAALDATISSVNNLASMLDSTATTIKDTQPAINKTNLLMSETLPDSINNAVDSLKAAKSAATSLESAIKQFEMFQTMLGGVPILQAALPPAGKSYAPEVSLAESLDELGKSIQSMPDQLSGLSNDLDKTSTNLKDVEESLALMSSNVSLIAESLGEYNRMIEESRASTDNLYTLISGYRQNSGKFLNTTIAVLTLFLLWLLASQVVIFSQGYELYQGTADRMESVKPSPPMPLEPETVPEVSEEEDSAKIKENH